MVVLAARTTGAASKDQKPSVLPCGVRRDEFCEFCSNGSQWLSGLQPSAMIDRKCEISRGEGG